MPAELKFRHVSRVEPDWDAVFRVAEIRNAGRDWFTGDTSEITPGEQVLWFAEKPRRILLAQVDDEIVGYALLSDRDGKTWVSLAVAPEHQGKGYGRQLYGRFYDVWAEIKVDNVASRRAAAKAGYRLVADNGETVVMHIDGVDMRPDS